MQERAADAVLLLANPRGCCAGVNRAIAIVEQLLDRHGKPIYVRRQIVHNREVVRRLADRGAIFVRKWTKYRKAQSSCSVLMAFRRPCARWPKSAGFVSDATCPLVSKVHYEAIKFAKAGLHGLLIGQVGHDEVLGTMGEIPEQITLIEGLGDVETVEVPDAARVAAVCQTTLSIDETRDIMAAIRRRFPQVKTPSRDDICYAAQNRQDAVRTVASRVDVMLVVGSQNSHGAHRLRDLAEQLGTRAYLVDNAEDVKSEWVKEAGRVGVTAWASTSEYLTQTIVQRVQQFGRYRITETGKPEPEIIFTMPREISTV